MKKLGLILFTLSMATAVLAQEKMSLTSRMAQKNILNHMDIGVNVGTVGIGIDVAVPVTDYVRIRAGYTYMPSIKFHSDFPIETNNGGSISNAIQNIQKVNLKKKASDLGIDLEAPKFKELKDDFDKFSEVTPKDHVTMNLKPNMHQFKFLVDILPFKHNKHWSLTTGFFIGSSNIGSAVNQSQETLLLEAINTYNKYYIRVCSEEGILGDHTPYKEIEHAFKDRGFAGFYLGQFKDGSKAMMVPNKDGTARAEMEVSKFRPYIGLGYNTHLSRNRKWNLNVDAGVMFLGGRPKVYVDNVYRIDENRQDSFTFTYYRKGFPFEDTKTNYDIVHPYQDDTNTMPHYFVDEPLQHVDMINDLDINSIPGKVGNMTRTISKFKVYPNLSVTVSYRLF